MDVELTNKIQSKQIFEDLTVVEEQNVKNYSFQDFGEDQNAAQNCLKQIQILPNHIVSQRDILQDVKIDLQKKKSSKNHEIYSHQNSLAAKSSQNSLNSKKLDDADKKFLKKLLKLDYKQKKKWYDYIIVAFKFALIQLWSPVFFIISIFKKKRKQVGQSFKERAALISISFYFFASSITLWICIINFIYILSVRPITDDQYEDFIGDYEKVFMYYAIICIAFAVLDSSIFKNSSLFYFVFKSLHLYSSTNIPKIMKQLFISESAFIFQFFEYPFEDESKVKQKQQIYYSGLHLSEKIIQYAEKNNVYTKSLVASQLFLSIILYVKAFFPGIFRHLNNEDFSSYSTYFTIMPFLCIGNLLSYFARTLNSLQDLNFIYDYNRALSALISYTSYLKDKPKYKINVPSINPIDLKSIKTWSQMRRLLNELKREETIPIDRCTIFLFVYLILILLGVFIGRFFKVVFFVNLVNKKYLMPYFAFDILLISCLFCLRVYKQVKINNQFKEQYKLLQTIKNFIIKFFACKEHFIEKEDITFLDKDIQWFFYSQINVNYMNCQTQLLYPREFIAQNCKNLDKNENIQSQNNLESEKNNEKQINTFNSEFDFQYSSKLIQLIDNIQDELQLDILQTPMKFLGLIPSTYGLLYTFISFIATFIYIATYVYEAEQ